MIIDSIENLENYSVVSQKTIDFLKKLTHETPVGHYEVDENVYVNVDVYNTKNVEDCKFESHKKFIDIQMLLEGEEDIYILPVQDLKISEEYCGERDVMFFENSHKIADKIHLEPFKFVYIMPSEAHKPQAGSGQQVKKVVVKIAKI